MHRALRAVVVAALGCVPLFIASHAFADVTIIGNGLAADCSASARAASHQARYVDALRACDLALENEPLSTHETAATYVNRGVLYLANRNYEEAKRDFDAASRVEPVLGEAYVNRGAALIGEGRDADGIADIDRGLSLNTSEPEKAYYNRALAEERQNDLKGAYTDYQKALEIKPGWATAQTELARFHVSQR